VDWLIDKVWSKNPEYKQILKDKGLEVINPLVEEKTDKTILTDLKDEQKQ